ncbi:uncharacterized protein NPIL_566091 [Nephila pilipes]|uniref:Uncharacterized protein n=1 Tax=Nephila pilipes TaxID=299642 RepID=A0A8X6QZH7_NEPPI|nr:uncharacterized protein NPIL_566091 [Nephila pilipes]
MKLDKNNSTTFPLMVCRDLMPKREEPMPSLNQQTTVSTICDWNRKGDGGRKNRAFRLCAEVTQWGKYMDDTFGVVQIVAVIAHHPSSRQAPVSV